MYVKCFWISCISHLIAILFVISCSAFYANLANFEVHITQLTMVVSLINC